MMFAVKQYYIDFERTSVLILNSVVGLEFIDIRQFEMLHESISKYYGTTRCMR